MRNRIRHFLFDSVKREAKKLEKSTRLDVQGPEFLPGLKSIFDDLFNELSADGGEYIAFNVELEFEFVPFEDEGEEQTITFRTPLFAIKAFPGFRDNFDTDTLPKLQKFFDSHRNADRGYPAIDLDEGTLYLVLVGMWFRRDQTGKETKGLPVRLGKHRARLRRARPIKRYWRLVKKLRRAGLSLKQARRRYRSLDTKARKTILKSRDIKTVKKTIKRKGVKRGSRKHQKGKRYRAVVRKTRRGNRRPRIKSKRRIFRIRRARRKI